MPLGSLPSDILLDIFTLVDNVQDLLSAASVTKHIHQTFLNHRATVLQHVFRNQILKHHADYLIKTDSVKCYSQPPGTPLCMPTPEVVLDSIDPIMARYEKTKLSDPLVLRSTAWATFTGLKSPEWVFTSLGLKLISCCRVLGHKDLALSYTAELWKHISTRQTFDHLIARNRFASDRYASSFARSLAKTYYQDFKCPEDAARTILECYDMGMRDNDYQLLSYVQKYTQDMADPAEVISFFRKRAATERNGLSDGSIKGDLHWIFCLTLLLSSLGKAQDAIDVFNDTYIIYPNSLLDPTTLEALSQRLIKSLIKQGHHDEAFTIYQQILTLFSHMHMNTAKKYMTWAEQYRHALYNADRPDEALAVEEQCWDLMRERLRTRRDPSLISPAGYASSYLYFSYKKRGRGEEGRAVREECRTLAEAIKRERVYFDDEVLRITYS